MANKEPESQNCKYIQSMVIFEILNQLYSKEHQPFQSMATQNRCQLYALPVHAKEYQACINPKPLHYICFL